MKNVKKIWVLLTRSQRYFIGFLMIAILINAMLETFSLALILPLVSLLNNLEATQDYPAIVRFAYFFGLTDNRTILIYLFYLFMVVYITKTAFFISLGYFRKKFVADVMNKLSTRLLKLYLNKTWTFHLNTNSAELQNNIIIQVGAICTSLIAALLTLSTEIVVALFIIILLISYDAITTLVAISLISLITLVFFYFIRGKLEHYGLVNEKSMAERLKIVNEAFGGIKETKILGREDYYLKVFEKKNLKYTETWIRPTFISMVFHSMIELVFIGGIVTTSLYILMIGKEAQYLFSILALFVAAATRLMPSVNRINGSIQTIKFHTPILSTIHDDIKIPMKKDKITESSNQLVPPVLMFQESITLENVCFRYQGTKSNTIDSISISIPKGYSVGFIGPSGAGKTTIIDIILGLLKPNSGKVMVDGYDIHENQRWWRKHIGYIPQNIYLSDNTIRNNIAFGIVEEQIDDNKVWEAIKNAQLDKVVNKLPEGIDTWIGEHGLKISGGQRQRIGIARALYNDPDILVLDEATSSLDTETEKEISDSINMLSQEKTLLIIAHRLTTVEKCDMKIYMQDGKVVKTIMKEKKAN